MFAANLHILFVPRYNCYAQFSKHAKTIITSMSDAQRFVRNILPRLTVSDTKIIGKIITGNSCLNGYMSKLVRKQSAWCMYCELTHQEHIPESMDHVVLDCPAYAWRRLQLLITLIAHGMKDRKQFAVSGVHNHVFSNVL